jgi:cell division protease FtsH
MAGRAAEEILLDGDHTQGAHGDLEMSTHLATAMVARYGMGSRMISRSEDRMLMDGPVGQEVDREVATLIEDGLDRARTLLATRRPLLERVAEELLDEETLSIEDLRALRFQDELGHRS